jgi:hypothetical protein
VVFAKPFFIVAKLTASLGSFAVLTRAPSHTLSLSL